MDEQNGMRTNKEEIRDKIKQGIGMQVIESVGIDGAKALMEGISTGCEDGREVVEGGVSGNQGEGKGRRVRDMVCRRSWSEIGFSCRDDVGRKRENNDSMQGSD